MINIYAPNLTSSQSSFFQALSKSISDNDYCETNCKFLIEGDFNVTLKPSLDCSGGNTALKESLKFLEDLVMEHDLVDIWGIRIPSCKIFTWRQKKSLTQKRLDYWFISDTLQDDVAKTDILTAIKTDHSAIVLEIDTLADHLRGPSFWKFNNSLLDDTIFVQKMPDNFPLWLEEISFCEDLRIKWDYIKYKVRQESIKYSKIKANDRKLKIKNIEDRLKEFESKVAEVPSADNLNELKAAWRLQCESQYDYIVRGSIIRSRATWYEQGERNSKYFLNLENKNKKKSCVRKLLSSDRNETTDANIILNEIHKFYSDLYNENLELQTCRTSQIARFYTTPQQFLN